MLRTCISSLMLSFTWRMFQHLAGLNILQLVGLSAATLHIRNFANRDPRSGPLLVDPKPSRRCSEASGEADYSMTCQNPESNPLPKCPINWTTPGARSVPQLIKRSISVIGSISVLQVQERVSLPTWILGRRGALYRKVSVCVHSVQCGAGTASLKH